MQEVIKRKRGRPKLTPEQKLERQRARIAELENKKNKKNLASKRKRQNKTKKDDKPVINNKTTFLLTPSGKCPVPLFGSDIEAIRIWAGQFKNTTQNGSFHTCQSLTYWLRYFFEIRSDEYKTAEKNLKEACQELEITDCQPRLDKLYKQIAKEIEANKKCNQSITDV